MGLVGLWGEWHTWPYDADTSDGCPNYFPTPTTVQTIVSAYDAAFNTTKLQIRYPNLTGAAAANIGFHDDSFLFNEDRGGVLKSKTLPASLGGWADDSFLTLALNAGAENKWITETVGGEVRPEIQSVITSTTDNRLSNVQACIELAHPLWMINQVGIENYSASDTKVADIVRKMGYELYAKQAYYRDVVTPGAALPVGVQIENRGVAPFPYPWKVEVALTNGTVTRTLETTWDLTKNLSHRNP